MELDSAVFEKLGSFYLGRPVGGDAPFLLDSRDLVTHAVCVGMTGSGKTGLCVGLLEEAAIDGVPALIVDPKGDLTNLALRFPRLDASDFEPWVSADEAARAGLSTAEFAAKQAELWKKGLADWGEDGARIRRFCEAADVAIFTPGSTAGRPVSILSSLAAPAAEEREDAELFAERVNSTAAALLGLAGVSVGDNPGREHALVSKIIETAWAQGETLEMTDLVRRIQKPPFASIGILDVESFYPEKDRFQLVLAFNNLLASPALAAWKEGDPLDVQKLLFTAEGRPRLAVLSIAHLSDEQRMFFVTLLLNAAVSWMRSQSGTSSLRALFYMDEVFGYLPPVANPPSKRPLLTLLKQARASGFGIVLATQNPSDLDYKALSNAGTWFIGRLQTERDKARLLGGIGDAGAADRERLEALFGELGKRRFVMHSVHENEPVLFESRWALSYLCGPLDRAQIRRLTGSEPAPARPSSAPASSGPPVLRKVPQLFQRGAEPGAQWEPRLLVSATMQVRDARRNVDQTIEQSFLAALPGGSGFPDWAAGVAVSPAQFSDASPDGAFAALPAGVEDRIGDWEKDAAAWIASRAGIETYRCPALKLESKAGESARDFQARVAMAARESRDADVAKIRAKFDRRHGSLDSKAARAQAAIDRETAQAGKAKVDAALSVGATLLGALFGRKRISASTIGRATTAAKGIGRTFKESGDIETARQALAKIQEERAELETELAAELARVSTATAEAPGIETVRVPPVKSSIRLKIFSVAWVFDTIRLFP